MRKSLTLIVLLLLSVYLLGQSPYGDQPLAHTYSIVAIDPESGDMGVAVQSHWFATGTLVIWGEAGVGVVATQSFVNPAFGPEGLAMMRAGQDPKSILQQLLAEDEGRESSGKSVYLMPRERWPHSLAINALMLPVI